MTSAICDAAIRFARLPRWMLRSTVAHTAIFPMQDALALGSESRMNLPGRTFGNWSWRIDESALSEKLSTALAKLVQLYGR
jgi:4-alpha-glucanotransferase